MDKRLIAVSSLIKDGIGFSDVGTDHAYLPIHMLQNGYTGNVIAMDIAASPLSVAKAHAAEYQLEDRIEFLLCDGLDACPKDKIDTIVIAGMGGDTICGILDRAPWCLDSGYTFILQPMTKAEILRFWLINNGFGITDELIVDDVKQKYQIIRTRFGLSSTLNDAQLFCGDLRLSNDKALYMTNAARLKARFDKAVTGLLKSPDPDMGKIRLYKNIVKQFNEILEKGENE